MNSWSGMVKFAKTGAEASSIAVELQDLILVKIILLFAVIMVGMIGI